MKYKKIILIFAFIISDKVSKKGLSKFCERQPLKNLKVYGLFKFFKGCLPQNLLSPLLNTLSHMIHYFYQLVFCILVCSLFFSFFFRFILSIWIFRQIDANIRTSYKGFNNLARSEFLCHCQGCCFVRIFWFSWVYRDFEKWSVFSG